MKSAHPPANSNSNVPARAHEFEAGIIQQDLGQEPADRESLVPSPVFGKLARAVNSIIQQIMESIIDDRLTPTRSDQQIPGFCRPDSARTSGVPNEPWAGEGWDNPLGPTLPEVYRTCDPSIRDCAIPNPIAAAKPWLLVIGVMGDGQ